jgi:nicotinate-nucleotide adenylyltransferase
MALEFLFRPPGTPARVVALFPGAWNPPTVAHLEIARAARQLAGEVVWVLPRRFPHKDFETASLDARAKMLDLIVRNEGSAAGFSAALSDEGLYVGIAAEAREFFGSSVEIALVCGRDAAERIAAWDYGAPGVFDAMLDQHRLLVAARAGDYRPPRRHRKKIVRLPVELPLDHISSSEIRRRIAAGLPWRELVPNAVAGLVEDLYA